MNNLNASEFLPNGSISSIVKFDHGRIPKTVAYCLLLLVSIVGNSLIVWIICRDNRLKNTTNFLVANMAVSDLLATTFLVPSKIMDINFGLNTWLITNNFGLALCKLVPFVHDTSLSVSMFSCVFIAIDRYYAVAHPMKGGFTRSRVKFIIAGIWMLSGLITSPYLYFFRFHNINGRTFCGLNDIFILKLEFYLNSAIIIILPLLIIAVLYILIVYKLYHHRTPGNQTDLAKKRREHQIRNVLKMSIAIVSLLSVSLLLGAIVTILKIEGSLNSLNPVDAKKFYFVARFIGQMSFIYNFFIYVIFNDIYRENVKAIIKTCCCMLTRADTRERGLELRTVKLLPESSPRGEWCSPR